MGLRRENCAIPSCIDCRNASSVISVRAKPTIEIPRRQEARDGEVVERGEELAPREVARRAEDDEDAWGRRALGLETDAEGVLHDAR